MRDQPVVGLGTDEVDGAAVAAVLDDPLQGLADAGRDLGGLGAPGDRLADDGLHVGIAQDGQGAAERRGELGGDPVGVFGLGQPGPEAPADAEGVEAGPDHVRGEEVLPDELAQGDPELVLLGGDDRGVRDGQAERAPEEGGHGEPVRERADHAGLGRGGDVPGPAARAPGVLGVLGQYVDQRDQDQQTGRGDLHPADPAAALLVGGAEDEPAAGGWRRWGRCGWCRWRCGPGTSCGAGTSGGAAVLHVLLPSPGGAGFVCIASDSREGRGVPATPVRSREGCRSGVAPAFPVIPAGPERAALPDTPFRTIDRLTAACRRPEPGPLPHDPGRGAGCRSPATRRRREQLPPPHGHPCPPGPGPCSACRRRGRGAPEPPAPQ